MLHGDLDLINHPELERYVHQAVVDEHKRALEEYKDIPLPNVTHLITKRSVIARREAIRRYCQERGHEVHHVMANKGNPLTMPDNGIKDTTDPAAEVRANVPPT